METYTKTLIQQAAEVINYKRGIKQSLNQVLEKYEVKDNVLVPYNGVVVEAAKLYKNCYFEVEAKYDSINEAINHLDLSNGAIRVVNNNEFYIGRIHRFIQECGTDKSKVFELSEK